MASIPAFNDGVVYMTVEQFHTMVTKLEELEKQNKALDEQVNLLRCKKEKLENIVNNKQIAIETLQIQIDQLAQIRTEVATPTQTASVPTVNSNLYKFETGAVRSTDADDLRYDLISPIAWRELAVTYREGLKYGAYNWMKGFPASSLINHALRHINLWMGGDRSDRHLAHAVWNILTLIHFEFTRPELNDMKGNDGSPHYKPKDCSSNSGSPDGTFARSNPPSQ